MGPGITWTLLIGGSILALLLGVPPLAVLIGAIIWFFIFQIGRQADASAEREYELRQRLQEEREKNGES